MADEGCGNTREGEEVLSLALISPVQATAAGKPGHRAFHDPAMAAQALAGLDATAGDPRQVWWGDVDVVHGASGSVGCRAPRVPGLAAVQVGTRDRE